MKSRVPALALAAVGNALIAWAAPAQKSLVTSSLQAATAATPDYIIIGGGLAGLTVANRLSEDPSINVLVIEAGGDNRTSVMINTVSTYSEAFGTSLDWDWQTTQQVGGSTKNIKGGKTLGGSSSINGAAWTRGATEQYDALEQLGNEGSLQPYFVKSEHFYSPNEAQKALGAGMANNVHGTSGPISASYTPANSGNQRRMYTDAYGDKFLQAASNALGLRHITDICNGDIHGTGATTPNSITPSSQVQQLRSSAATGYISPIEYSRSNIKVLVGWRGVKALFQDAQNPTRVTGAVLQQSKNGAQQNVTAKKAVIVAAGAIRSPQFLELSGIGDSNIIEPLGIKTVVDLKGVGRNLQDQTMNTIGAAIKSDFQGSGPSSTIAYPTIWQLFSNASAVKTHLEKNYDTYAAQIVAAGGAVSADAVKAQWKIQTDLLWNKNTSASELFADHGFPSGQFGQDTWPLLVYSRGSVHISENNAFHHASVDPGYYRLPIDMDVNVATLRTARRLYQTSPLQETLNSEQVPGFGKVPNSGQYGSYADWQKWILKGYVPVSHQLGTCQMAPQSLGGVVDSSGRVYGVDAGSLRVVDASILPMQFSAHLSSSLYAIAEKFADSIKNSS
ncbi:GMC oxidoreductase [Tilletiaria anomala UBC 951]|uniref:GMC oxidoreductase n=1 Tax=Tilletiaria anomala (strain ATCC 24038 / CBS 436.72 / UBC 951) TaxID=1037660 RepID=A0A066WRC3_TILAU|nr:GMC oxidoreductase [Tilletiaria anomala UBC 951]KDN53554.1 GMC oxidoreductase [Tilletiaria anomala UBC 951]